jgi:IrrE N-terminal-like domain
LPESTAVGSDRYIRPRSEETISLEAEKCRQLSTAALSYDFNVADFIEEYLQSKLWRGYFDIEFFNRRNDNEDPAFVKYMPLELHFDRGIWQSAKYNIPFARYIAAHEVGHIWLHDKFDLAYSVGKENQLKYADDIHSAEWQANTFAHHFLIPNHVVDKMITEDDIISFCKVEPQVASKRYHDRIILGSQSIFAGGLQCRSCFRHDVYLTVSGVKCIFCKADAPFAPGLIKRADPDLTINSSHREGIEPANPVNECSKALHTGEPCPRCANFSLLREKGQFRCNSCQYKEGINQQYKLDI